MGDSRKFEGHYGNFPRFPQAYGEVQCMVAAPLKEIFSIASNKPFVF